MIKLFNTVITQRTVLRSSWLVNFAGATLLAFLKDATIVLEPFHCSNDLLTICGMIDFAWVYGACHYVRSVAEEHEHRTNVLVNVWDSVIWKIWEAFLNVNIEPSCSTDKVDYLHERIWFFANVVLKSFNSSDKPFTTDFPHYWL